jgi:hypothetical protein
VHSNARADARIFAESVGWLISTTFRLLVLGARAVVAAVRGDR